MRRLAGAIVMGSVVLVEGESLPVVGGCHRTKARHASEQSKYWTLTSVVYVLGCRNFRALFSVANKLACLFYYMERVK
jgi:hypothetical protein